MTTHLTVRLAWHDNGRRDEHRASGTVRAYYDALEPTQVVIRPRGFPGSGAAALLGAVFVGVGAGLLGAGSR